MKWKPFHIEGEQYCLSHLHPFTFKYVFPAKGGKPEQNYSVHVQFSMHCFTRGIERMEKVPAEWAYADNRETRRIDLDRYKLSFKLPHILKLIGDRKCFHTSHGAFFTIELLGEDGNTEEYTVYFSVAKNGNESDLRLFVKSAYVQGVVPRPKRRKPCRFSVIAWNTKNGKPLKPPK